MTQEQNPIYLLAWHVDFTNKTLTTESHHKSIARQVNSLFIQVTF